MKLLLKISTEENLSSVIDTASIRIIDKQTDAIVKQLKGDLYFKLKKGSNYYIDINVLDNYKKTIYNHNLFTNKESINSRQNFYI